jgi:acyl-CoA synthetase (NDP forming)
LVDSLNDLYVGIDRLSAWSAFRVRGKVPVAAAQELPATRAYAGVVPDAVAKKMLAQAGMRAAQEGFATDAENAAACAERIGFPVVMKVVSERISHKTEAKGVFIGIGNRAEAMQTFSRIMANAHDYLGEGHAEGVAVQEQVVGGTEVILGLKIDPVLGPFVLVGVGGIFTELLEDVAVRPAPVDAATARAMIDQLRGAALLHGFRGKAPLDVEALVDAVVSFSRFGAAQKSWLTEADLNPVIVLEQGKGVRVVDA